MRGVMDTVTDPNEKIAYLRSCVVGELVECCARVFIDNEDAVMEGRFEGPLLSHIPDMQKNAYRGCNDISWAKIYRAQEALGVESGMMLCNPIDKEFEVPEEVINPIIERAVRDAEEAGVHGKDSTPFILARVKELSGGDSMQANIKLVQSNVRLASQLAIALKK